MTLTYDKIQQMHDAIKANRPEPFYYIEGDLNPTHDDKGNPAIYYMVMNGSKVFLLSPEHDSSIVINCKLYGKPYEFMPDMLPLQRKELVDIASS